MNLAHRADGARPNHFAQPAVAFARMPLVAHLRNHSVFARRQRQLARFPDRVRQRLLAINMFARRHRQHRRRPVLMIRDGDAHRVQRLLLVHHHPVIPVKLRALGKFFAMAFK
jgi:hypothetical protein